MKNYFLNFKTGIFYTLAGIIFLSCSDEESITGEEKRGYRLKRLEACEEIRPLLGSILSQDQDIFIDELRLTGNYPGPVHNYDINCRWKKEELYFIPGGQATIEQHVGVDGRVGLQYRSREEINGIYPEYEVISDTRLQESKYSDIYITKRTDNSKEDWKFTMYIGLTSTNQDMQSVSLYGFYYPGGEAYYDQIPDFPSDAQAVDAFLALIEEKQP